MTGRDGFELLCEIERATGPDLTRVRRQIAMLIGIADAFLVPDNHLGRATVSSIAVAREVAALGGSVFACLNGRDRSLLGFRRDLLTAAAYGIDNFLFVRGDEPSEGQRSGDDLTLHRMIDEAHAYPDRTFVAGATVRVETVLPAWKAKADHLLAQVSYDVDRLSAWRDASTVCTLSRSAVMERWRACYADIDAHKSRSLVARIESTHLPRIRSHGPHGAEVCEDFRVCRSD